MKHTLDSLTHPLKERFLETVFERVDPDLCDDHLEAYVLAGEHQDGEGFWDHFATVSQVVRDFHRFIDFRESI